MDNICFVIMPFGIGFDDLYEKVYVPAIQSQGLSPLRADEIYDNQPIIRDITQSIHHAKVILADVTGRNPNVNYELGIAHALKKEVILLTAESKDVPSDYRHLRYLQYNRMDVDWNQTLSQELQATLKQVLSRLSQSDKTIPSTAPRQSAVLYVADIKRIFYNRFRGDHFYQIDGLLPTSLLKEEPVSGENHWLADWAQKEARCKAGDTVRFKVHKIYDLKDYNHTSNARNVNFSQLEVVSSGSEDTL